MGQELHEGEDDSGTKASTAYFSSAGLYRGEESLLLGQGAAKHITVESFGPPLGGELLQSAVLLLARPSVSLSPVCEISPLPRPGFILTSFPRAPHTSWNSFNYAPSMAQRSK
ncbi:unnamed protein product [Pleuronectes platessa]|uniref:Uncharacterized protein n=1 Tax=Pleuronectes platessa TaxID=8262 RepID=A0A9N7Z0Q8_PLEPL|nr:unnamed protein product [Pleuronectes platessa]